MSKFFRAVWRMITFPFRAVWWILTLPFRAVRSAHHFLTFEISEDDEDRSVLSIWDHIEVLRKHLLRALIALILASVAGWFLAEPTTALLAAPVGGPQNLQVIDLTESIGVFMKIAVMLGLGISIPYIAFEIWYFSAYGLNPRERRTFLIAIPLTALLFYLGVYFTYRWMLPPAIEFLMNFGEFTANPTAERYYSLLTRLLVWIGLFFEFPLVVYLLTSIGVVKPKQLAQQWRVAVVAIAVIAAMVTPTTDMGSMALVMAPMIVLYLIGILLSYVAYAARMRRIESS
jgi:sec-independent protein translocase protein TatC